MEHFLERWDGGKSEEQRPQKATHTSLSPSHSSGGGNFLGTGEKMRPEWYWHFQEAFPTIFLHRCPHGGKTASCFWAQIWIPKPFLWVLGLELILWHWTVFLILDAQVSRSLENNMKVICSARIWAQNISGTCPLPPLYQCPLTSALLAFWVDNS